MERTVASLGPGGMCEVWLSRDGGPGREVALEVIPADFAGKPDRLSRFAREARGPASLGHPGIATLSGLAKVYGRYVPVMELVEREGLDERIARAPVPDGDVVTIARQIADGPEVAHGKGIVLRDLVRGNVRLRPGGTVTVPDFGLATEWWGDASERNVSTSPTKSRNATAAGVTLGTAGPLHRARVGRRTAAPREPRRKGARPRVASFHPGRPARRYRAGAGTAEPHVDVLRRETGRRRRLKDDAVLGLPRPRPPSPRDRGQGTFGPG